VQLPGKWDFRKLANSSWTVELARSSPKGYRGDLFVLGQSGETTGDGFYILVRHRVATVHINAPFYGAIDTIRVVRTVRTSSDAASVYRGAQKAQPRTAR
jgi:hypothetical protein